MHNHISKYQLEKKYGGYIDNLDFDRYEFWPPKVPNTYYWLDDETDNDKFISPEMYYK